MPYSKDMLIEIYKSQHERFRDSRSNQWRINITFWTLLVLAIAYNQISIENSWLTFICILLFGLHFAFIIIIQINFQTEKKVWSDIINFLNNPSVDIEKPMHYKVDTSSVKMHQLTTRAWFWISFQIIITTLLLAIFLVTHWKKNC